MTFVQYQLKQGLDGSVDVDSHDLVRGVMSSRQQRRNGRWTNHFAFATLEILFLPRIDESLNLTSAVSFLRRFGFLVPLVEVAQRGNQWTREWS